MEQKGIIALGVTVMIAVIILSVIFSITFTATNTASVTNESFTGIVNSYVALENDNWASVSEVRNASHDALVENTDYEVDLVAGAINITTGNDGTYYADYTYYPDMYITSGTSRMLVSYIPVILAVVIMMLVAAGIYLKKRGE
jgi:hypothetical protein